MKIEFEMKLEKGIFGFIFFLTNNYLVRSFLSNFRTNIYLYMYLQFQFTIFMISGIILSGDKYLLNLNTTNKAIEIMCPI